MYEQIKDQIRSQIYSGELREGDALPSLRELARDLQVSVITTTRAYNDLAAEGVIATRQGRGTLVLPVNASRMQERLNTRITTALQDAIEAARLGDLSLDHLQTTLAELWNGSPREIPARSRSHAKDQGGRDRHPTVTERRTAGHG